MPVSAVISTRQGQFSVVRAELPGHGLVNLGVLVEDPHSDALFLRFRRDWDSLVEDEDLDVLSGLADDLSRKASEMGAAKLFEYLDATLSAGLLITDREPIMTGDFSRAVDRLYRQKIQSNVQPFLTHLPQYSLQVAAGEFLENREPVEEGWIEAPENLRLTSDMFVAHIAGESMEPLIPDGSLCVFRRGVTGSREGRLVLVEDRSKIGTNRYTVKRYHSLKEPSGHHQSDPEFDQQWAHKWIQLESLNPGHPSWFLDRDEEKSCIIAEFVRVLD